MRTLHLFLLTILCQLAVSAIWADSSTAAHKIDREGYVDLDGTKNFRDIGNILTTDGRAIKPGLLFRSDKLADLTEADQQRLEELQIRYVVDFRTSREQRLDPDNLSAMNGARYVHLPLHDKDVPATTWERIWAMMFVDDMSNVLVKSNQDLIIDGTDGLRSWFALLLEPGTTPMVFHCSGGKDRTGLATALLLAALDVPQEAIYNDYLATNRYVGKDAEETLEKIERYSLGFIEADDVRPIFEANRRYLDAAFETIELKYGSLANYLETGLGLDEAKRARLRTTYLD